MQEFFINKGATLPHLFMELIDDGRNTYNHIFDYIQNADIYFSVVDIETGVPRVVHQPALAVLKENPNCSDEYVLCYMWKDRDTIRPGRYRGQFEIVFSSDQKDEGNYDDEGTTQIFMGEPDGNLIVPIHEELLINVQDGTIKK